MARASALHFTAPPFIASPQHIALPAANRAAGSWGLYIFSNDPLLSVFQELVPSPLDPHDAVLWQAFPGSAPPPGRDGESRRWGTCIHSGGLLFSWGSVVRWVNTIRCSTPATLSFSIFTKSFASEQHQLETALSLSVKSNCTKHKQNIFFLNPK